MSEKKKSVVSEEPETIVEKKPKRKTTKKAEPAVEPTVEAVTPEQKSPEQESPEQKSPEQESSVPEILKPKVAEAEKPARKKSDAAEAAPEEPKPKVQRRNKFKQSKVIDEEARDARAGLKGAKQSMTILTGILERVEMKEQVVDPDTDIYAVTHYNGFKVIIPASHMGLTMPPTASPQEKASLYRKYISAMLTCEFVYVILGVGEKDKIALGSRKIAMGIRRKQMFVNKYRNTNVPYMQYAMEEQIPVEAKVMAVSGTLVRLDVSGVECKVYAKDAAWRYTSNLSTLFYPGDTVKVIVKHVEHRESGEWYAEVSIKEASPNKQVENAATFKVGSVCSGTVSGVTEKGYYISLGDASTGIDAFCNQVPAQQIPQIGDMVACLLTRIDNETGFAIAKVTRILRKANRVG